MPTRCRDGSAARWCRSWRAAREGLDVLRARHRPRTPASPPSLAADLPPRGASLEALTAVGRGHHRCDARVSSRTWSPPTASPSSIDRYLTHPVFGMLAFAVVMCGLFWTLFTLAAIPMDLIEALFGHVSAALTVALPAGPVRDLMTQGIVGGLSGTVVFLPQICLLFFLISILEDTGYLARAAFVMDGTAVAVRPAGPGVRAAADVARVRAARHHERAADPEPARPAGDDPGGAVHELLGAAAGLRAADQPAVRGSVLRRHSPSPAATCSAPLAGLLTASLFGRTALKGAAQADDPGAAAVPHAVAHQRRCSPPRTRGFAFLRTAGTVIMAICIVMWWLSAYPKVAAPAEAEALRAQAAQLQASRRSRPTRCAPRQTCCRRRPSRPAASPAGSASSCSRCSRRSASTGS